MAKKYKNKFAPQPLRLRCDTRQERGGNWYGVYEIPLDISSEGLDYCLRNIIRIKHITFQDQLDRYRDTGKGPLKKKYGAATVNRDEFKKRDEKIYEIYLQEKAKGVGALMIPHIILGRLKKEKILKKDQDLSDRQIRRIIKEQKQRIYLDQQIKRIRELGGESKPQQ